MRADSEGAILDDLAAFLAGVVVVGPNQPAPTVAAGAKWGKVTHLTIPTVEATMGPKGLDRIGGIVQVSMHYPLATGDAEAAADSVAFEARYYSGRALLKNGAETIVQGCNPSGGKESGGWFVQHLSIPWLAYTVRGG